LTAVGFYLKLLIVSGGYHILPTDSTGDKASPIVPYANPIGDEANVIVHCKDLMGD
jgi:hypothetical protein